MMYWKNIASLKLILVDEKYNISIVSFIIKICQKNKQEGLNLLKGYELDPLTILFSLALKKKIYNAKD